MGGNFGRHGAPMSSRDDASFSDPRSESGAAVHEGSVCCVDIDALRGWKEHRLPELREEHRLPALARLVRLDDTATPVADHPIHGPRVVLGRYQPRHGPVDLRFARLLDHQRYRLGAPHAHLEHIDGQWHLQMVAPRAQTSVNERDLTHLHSATPLHDGTELTLGVTRFRFRTSDVSLLDWRRFRGQLLEQIDEPTLFLKRRGGICGPRRRLSKHQPLLLGRSHPEPGTLPGTDEWPPPADNSWDLSGLFGRERKYVAFRHAAIEWTDESWAIRPLSDRRHSFVNRRRIREPTALEGGDEIGLGSVLFYFAHPGDDPGEAVRPPVPEVVDWCQDRPPGASVLRRDSQPSED